MGPPHRRRARHRHILAVVAFQVSTQERPRRADRRDDSERCLERPATSPAHAIRPDRRQTSVRCGFLKVLSCGLEESPERLATRGPGCRSLVAGPASALLWRAARRPDQVTPLRSYMPLDAASGVPNLPFRSDRDEGRYSQIACAHRAGPPICDRSTRNDPASPRRSSIKRCSTVAPHTIGSPTSLRDIV